MKQKYKEYQVIKTILGHLGFTLSLLKNALFYMQFEIEF